MLTLIEKSGENLTITREELAKLLRKTADEIASSARKVLLVPPDMTRLNSQAGPITAMLYAMLSPRADVDIIPALGTHAPMTEHELRSMFGPEIPLSRFKVHDWRKDIVKMGTVPGALLKEWSEGKVDYDVNVEVNRILFEGYDLIISIGQVVPHEVVGMANYTKNLMVGVGGADTINKSHFLGAACNMERIMGQSDTPVRRLFNYGVCEFLGNLPVHYIHTVMARNDASGKMEMRGFFAGNSQDVFLKAAELSRRVNLLLLDKPLDKVLVYLDPEEFKSTWLGNKAVYRTRMSIADGGELIILAPGLREFGEDKEIDRLIRKYGYRGTPATLDALKANDELRKNLSAAAHLIHGSSEGRFTISYCPGPKVSADEIRSVGFKAGDLATMNAKYQPEKLRDGENVLPSGERLFYISNPALGLWALKEKFKKS
ncbi:MAG: D-mannonate epimerase [Lentisphaerae bacterium GWF2_52_8]|nr:MAG: D-mannonate epimerase [Lentisphaerae bacterium GWF2_52_8]